MLQQQYFYTTQHEKVSIQQYENVLCKYQSWFPPSKKKEEEKKKRNVLHKQKLGRQSQYVKHKTYNTDQQRGVR